MTTSFMLVDLYFFLGGVEKNSSSLQVFQRYLIRSMPKEWTMFSSVIKTGDEWNPEWTWQVFRSAQRSERSQASAAFIVLASSMCQITRATEETDDPQPFLLYSARILKKWLNSLAKRAPNLALRWNWPSWCIFPSLNYSFLPEITDAMNVVLTIFHFRSFVTHDSILYSTWVN